MKHLTEKELEILVQVAKEWALLTNDDVRDLLTTSDSLRGELAKDKHTPCPNGYLQWHTWADKMSKTHRQVQCPCCGLWAIWIKKGPADE